jgi:hypothetical protein
MSQQSFPIAVIVLATVTMPATFLSCRIKSDNVKAKKIGIATQHDSSGMIRSVLNIIS